MTRKKASLSMALLITTAMLTQGCTTMNHGVRYGQDYGVSDIRGQAGFPHLVPTNRQRTDIRSAQEIAGLSATLRAWWRSFERFGDGFKFNVVN